MRVEGRGLRVQGSLHPTPQTLNPVFRVQGSGFRVQGAGFRMQGSGCRVQGAGFRVQGALACDAAPFAGCKYKVQIQGANTGCKYSYVHPTKRANILVFAPCKASPVAMPLQGLGFRVQGSGFRVQGCFHPAP